jgi:hypothetical protein
VPGIEDRAQHGIGEKAKVVSFIDQQSGAGPAVEVMVDRRWGYVVGAIRLGDQQLDQHDQRRFPAAAYGTEQGEPRRNGKSVEHASVQQPERDGHAFSAVIATCSSINAKIKPSKSLPGIPRSSSDVAAAPDAILMLGEQLEVSNLRSLSRAVCASLGLGEPVHQFLKPRHDAAGRQNTRRSLRAA